MSDKLRRLKEEMILVYGLNCWMNELWIPNKLDMKYHKLYKELNGLFQELNRSYAPPTKQYYDEIAFTLRKIRR